MLVSINYDFGDWPVWGGADEIVPNGQKLIEGLRFLEGNETDLNSMFSNAVLKDFFIFWLKPNDGFQ